MVAILFILLNLETYILVFQVLDRGEKIELLVDKSENLRFQVWTIGFFNITNVGGFLWWGNFEDEFNLNIYAH